ncbi:hypothetical protein GFH48_24235 [Streptomyces fagopyri]|uniref:DUF916 domain-containing protein n=1 Tax=Streptomyces fagopyri TaxID=2662397 RepID=A0A5Q0LGK7_9ACTN|nr:hypothetical protein [Streptomyces fagopyri]QFZ75954.1 hypothetical protein GFH48_24235 [Streptomyces fagopyri]
MPYARVLCCAVGALLSLTAPPAAAAEDDWSVVPSAGTGTARPYVYAEGTPGTVLQDTVSVLNPAARPLTVRLRGADADSTARGGFTVRTTGRATDTGAWIAFAEERGGHREPAGAVSVRIPARTRADVPFSVSVPPGATPGDHPGAIVASAGGRSAAVRVRLRVGGPALPALTVEHVTYHGGRVSYELVNRGNTVLGPRLAVRADGVLGRVLDRPPRALPVELPPGRRVTLTEPWRDPPALDAVDVRLTVTAAGGARATASTPVRFVPWGAVAGAGCGLVAVAALLVLRRRGRGTRDDRACASARTEAEWTGAVS